MELINSTRMVAGYTVGTEPSGREIVVVVVKGTFRIPKEGEAVGLAEEQVPLVVSDTFFGEPGRSAPRHEAEFVIRKPLCDVLLHATAYAPHGRPVTSTRVRVRIGNWNKTFSVIGDRVWQVGTSNIRASSAVPFLTMPITYDRAFGGTDNRSDDPMEHAAFMKNPSGRGFHKQLKRQWLDGSLLPNTETDGQPVMRPDGDYDPMSFGPLGRHWEPRFRYAGTYDDNWLEQHFPFLPPDFDERYYQAAPHDQQVPHLRGGEEVELLNLTSEGRVSFVLPIFDAPVHFFPRKGNRENGTLTLDTLNIEPDSNRFTLTWRTTRRLRRNIFEVAQAMVGKRSREWWAEREKPGFPVWLNLVSNETRESSDSPETA
jgi:hypothetical protein